MQRPNHQSSWRRRLLALALGGTLTACQFPTSTAPANTPATIPDAVPQQYAPQSVADGEHHGLTYDMKLVSNGLIGSEPLAGYRVQQTAEECPPPLHEPREKIWPNGFSLDNKYMDCEVKDSRYWYYVVTDYPTYVHTREWQHYELSETDARAVDIAVPFGKSRSVGSPQHSSHPWTVAIGFAGSFAFLRSANCTAFYADTHADTDT